MKKKQKEWHPTTKPLKRTPRAPSCPLQLQENCFLSRCQVIKWAYGWLLALKHLPCCPSSTYLACSNYGMVPNRCSVDKSIRGTQLVELYSFIFDSALLFCFFLCSKTLPSDFPDPIFVFADLLWIFCWWWGVRATNYPTLPDSVSQMWAVGYNNFNNLVTLTRWRMHN